MAERHDAIDADDAAPADGPAAIVPERALQRAADAHDWPVDALRAAVREDLERNRRLADRIADRRPRVHSADEYDVYHATDAVSTETPLAVLSVYRHMDGSDTDYVAGYPLVVPRDDGGDTDTPEFESASERVVDR